MTMLGTVLGLLPILLAGTPEQAGRLLNPFLKKWSPDLVTVQGDVADPNTASLVFKEALDRFGRFDTLINNAGTFIAKPFTSYSNDDYATYIATNVTGFFHMTQRAMEMMSQARRGHVVTVTFSLVDQPMSSVPGEPHQTGRTHGCTDQCCVREESPC
jgi:NAD(P)-dependent dehydrogenase (short-subunit alcohol dehydrogenase family)